MQKEQDKRRKPNIYPLLGARVGTLEGVPIYESKLLGTGYNSGGLALPGIGIVVGIDAFSKRLDLGTVRHEFGHILQARVTGKLIFYLFIGLPSLLSAWLNWHGRGHQRYWTEVWCNHLAKGYFQDSSWSNRRFPCRDISTFTKYWLTRTNERL